MTQPDGYDTILRPARASTPFERALGNSGADGLDEVDGFGEVDELGEFGELDGSAEVDDADTVVRDPTAPAASVSEDDDDLDEEAPHPTEALRFRISNGEAALVLDEDVHIGRNPRPPRVDSGRPVRLLRVESPTGVVSSSHLGLRRVGSTAVAVDLMSTNGSVVFLPGFPPRRLRQGESLVAPPGTRLEIGEGIVIEVLQPSGLD